MVCTAVAATGHDSSAGLQRTDRKQPDGGLHLQLDAVHVTDLGGARQPRLYDLGAAGLPRCPVAHPVPDRIDLVGIRCAVESALRFQRAASDVLALPIECRHTV